MQPANYERERCRLLRSEARRPQKTKKKQPKRLWRSSSADAAAAKQSWRPFCKASKIEAAAVDSSSQHSEATSGERRAKNVRILRKALFSTIVLRRVAAVVVDADGMRLSMPSTVCDPRDSRRAHGGQVEKRAPDLDLKSTRI